MDHVGMGFEMVIDLVINRSSAFQTPLREQMLLRDYSRSEQPTAYPGPNGASGYHFY